MSGPPNSVADAELSVDGERLLARLNILAALGGGGSRGVTRLAWSPADIAARDLVGRWAANDAGAAVRVDPAGNLVADVPGADASLSPLVLGSHLDTVVDAGALDGTYGVVAALEVAAALRGGRIRLRHPLRVVAFANEEGVVAAPFTGSRAVTGAIDDLDLEETGPDGRTLAARLRDGGGDPQRLRDAVWPDGVAAYLELHIEQGPVLDTAGIDIGVVTAIAGRRRATVTVQGRANHAGTTPMELRHDALVGAAHVVLAVQALALEGLTEVATVGTISARPGNVNGIAGTATLGVDIRSVDDARRDRALDILAERLALIGEQTGTTIGLSSDLGSAAASCDPWLGSVIAQVAARRHSTWVELPSGAGHDAQHLSALGPIGMIFVPSIGGVSHSPAEATDAADLTRGAQVLLDVLVRADAR